MTRSLLVVTVTDRELLCSSVFIGHPSTVLLTEPCGATELSGQRRLGSGDTTCLSQLLPQSLFVQRKHKTAPVTPASSGLAVSALSYAALAQVPM